MNIKEAKTEVENAVKAYLIKDKYGKYKFIELRPWGFTPNPENFLKKI